nr:putative ribonuclease H-like domain-containing protein [Tanacetum cinerariifolium]
GNPQHALKDKGVINSGCSRHMIGNMSYLSDFEELNGGYVAFGGNPKGGKIFRKGKIRTCKLDFYDVYFVEELNFNLFSVSQMHDKKNGVLFTDTKCLVLSPDFKLPDESQVLLRVPRENNMYNVNLKDIVPSRDLTCLFTKETLDESNLWHRRLGHINFKTMNKLVKGSGPTWLFDIDTLTNTMNYQPVTTDTSQLPDDPDMPELEDITYSDDEDDVGAEVDFNNLETSIIVSPIPTTRVHKDHPVTQILGDLSSATQTRSMTRVFRDQGVLSQINIDDIPTCMFACFLLQEEPKRVHQALKDLSWNEAMQEELLPFKMQKVWVLADLPHEKRAIGTKWIFRNKKDERGIVVRNKARLVAQGHTHEEGIDYKEVFAPVARIEAIRLFLAYASFMGFMVYQMDVKSAFLYETIEEEVYVCQPLGFENPDYPDKVYKVVKTLYGLHQAPRAWYETLANYLLENSFQRGKIDQTLFIKRLPDGKSASTPIDTIKTLLKDPNGEDIDVYTYKSMIGSFMYLTSSRPNILFAVCACARFQVTPKALHLHAVKRIFRHLKGKPYLGLWYPKDSPVDLVAYSDSDYAGASLDRKSITEGCQFLRYILIYWQCKKQTVMTTSSTEDEYVATASCCAQVIWI